MPTSKELYEEYCDGLPGAPLDPVFADSLIEDGIVKTFAERGSNIKGLHKERPRVLLYKALRELDPTALSDESQDTGDCTSHGTRNAGDLSRAVEIIVAGQPDRFVRRGATEYIYAGRGHGGQGMNAGRATKIISEGQLLRKDYTSEGGPDLRQYNARIGMSKGRSGIPNDWKAIAEDELACTDWIAPSTVEDGLDCMAAGYGGHAGSMYGTSRSVGRDGINRKSKSWSHDMAHAGYDLTEEIFPEPVVFVPNSWAGWNQPNPVWKANEDVLGPWIPGMIVMSLEDYGRHVLRSRETYYLVEFEGDGIKALPLQDYGSDYSKPIKMDGAPLPSPTPNYKCKTCNDKGWVGDGVTKLDCTDCDIDWR